MGETLGRSTKLEFYLIEVRASHRIQLGLLSGIERLLKRGLLLRSSILGLCTKKAKVYLRITCRR